MSSMELGAEVSQYFILDSGVLQFAPVSSCSFLFSIQLNLGKIASNLAHFYSSINCNYVYPCSFDT